MELFKRHLLQAKILDPIGVHHEFAYGTHGQKIDFDLIPSNSPLYTEWVNANANFIHNLYKNVPQAVIGVANGTNRLATDVAQRLGIQALITEKSTPRTVQLTAESILKLKDLKNELVLVLEDVGTSGGTALTAAESAIAYGALRVEVLFSWQRNQQLSAFNKSSIKYHAIINQELPTYTPEQCRQSGYCSMGWKLVSR